uniref:Uncharacterized protein n=1 Tax=Strombidium inclinatum TaxID=197538 RepID=A0A7S3MTW4_9SPIT|mmetsp:Transcript_1219/g.1386  ORF Transcript_1219/g.1386 Transcript_1219/m.1386 type:complete len:132 (+) Transcript_1219:721-1116(+)
MPSRFQRQQAYLRSLKFGSVRDKFLLVRTSGSAQKKVTLAYYLVPALLATGMACNNYLQVSFGVYLKYQGMVDQLYKRRRNELTSEIDEAKVLQPSGEIQLIKQSKDLVERSSSDPRFVPQFKMPAAQQQQ